MSTKKKILFVINPISGGKRKTAFKKQILETLDLSKFEPTFQQTDHAGHAYELAKQAVLNKYDVVVAVGGDGTINEIGSALAGTDTPLGIIPEGSGNGLALYLGIPLHEAGAIRRINRFDTMTVDTGSVNERFFFNVAGVGFDASVSDKFATDSIRGPIGYLRTVMNLLGSYRSKKYQLSIDGKSYTREAFMISVANSPQYGNNAYIAPNASVTDGLIDVCIVHKFPLYLLPMMVFHLFNKSVDQSEYVEIIPGRVITIESDEIGPVHVDGEPLTLEAPLQFTVQEKSLKIIC
ncbi:diacylglycerol kinase family lipid kinase [Sphingobacterium sp. lm-10]|uniref:diacylglycerol/lipid kinase family protein n=1 Tax=Sphingobacterium sp. lm-10 TaxID=2944904 RepID=UPI002021DAC4|nr:diacylglycerol kinase family protein [Sphingobacterium sp. lm-10]MCL7988355.1 diacylglycerol kinase family lipid kinase [Sphingobacterium sp. lm-10]